MNIKSNTVFKEVRNYIFIAFGIFMYAFGWSAFLIPSKLVGGGVAGISTLVYWGTFNTFGWGMPVGASNLIINAILVIIAMRILGAKFGINTIYGILVSSIAFMILQPLFPEPLLTDRFMCILIAGALSGTGIAIAFLSGGNSGGTDIIALIVTNYYNISVGKVILFLDIFIIGSSYFVFKDVETLAYGYVMMAIFSYALDTVIEGRKQSYQIMIFSKSKSKQIADRIVSEIGRGVTVINGTGWFTKTEQDVLIVVARRDDRSKVMSVIKEEDPEAFISLTSVQGVFGKNFEKIKI